MRSLRIDRGRREGAGHRQVVLMLALACGALALAAPAVSAAYAGSASEGPPKKLPLEKPPSVSTGASRVSGSGVELEGTVNPRGEAATYYFQYGPTVAYGAQTSSVSLPAGSAKVAVSQTVTGLQSGYHYRLVATDGAGTAIGLDRTYTAKPLKTIKTTTTTKTGLKFTLSRPPAEGQVVGSPITIEGTLSGPGAAGHGIVLQSSPYSSGAVFTNVGAQQTASSAGHFSFFIAHLAQSTRFRLAAVGPQPTYSPVITELATVRVTLHVRSAQRAGLVRLYGTVSPAVKGAIVYFQLQEPGRPPVITIPKSEKAEERAEERAEIPRYAIEFNTPVRRATKSLSRFSMVTTIRKSGLYRAFVQVPKGPLASGHSASVTLNATIKKQGKRV
jgi:hypothetical protein